MLRRNRPSALLTLSLIAGAAQPAAAQDIRFSLETGGNALGLPGSDGMILRAGSILAPTWDPPGLGPAPLPKTTIPSPTFGVPIAPGEVDAFSFGMDAVPSPALTPGTVWFSVDRASPGLAPTAWPGVRTEVPEAGSDAFVNVDGIPALPAGDAVVGDHAAVLDGNGLEHPSTLQRRPAFGVPEPSNAIDGLDQLVGSATPSRLFFSLASGAAGGLGVSQADVLTSGLSGSFTTYISAASLGLDPLGDDIDALAVWDDGDGTYEPPADQNDPETPYLWGEDEGDLVFFSVTRESPVVGRPDSHFGLPIQPGDVLTIPEPGSAISIYPAIVIAAERMFLATDRTLLAAMDDLDALDLTAMPLYDCNGNGVEDAADIGGLTAPDSDGNGFPDVCEAKTTYCTAGTSAIGCTALMSCSGLPSATASSGFVVTASGVNGATNGLFFFSTGAAISSPWGSSSSFKCVSPPSQRTGLVTASGSSGGCGDMSRDLNMGWCPSCPKPGTNPGVGATVRIQAWYRDPMAAGFTKTAMSDALEFQVLP